MWLINTTTLELKSFIFNASMPRYTILSHTWGDEELSLQEWHAIAIARRSHSLEASDLMRKQGFKKIKHFCDLSRNQSFCRHWEGCYGGSSCNLVSMAIDKSNFQAKKQFAMEHCCKWGHSDRRRAGPCKCVDPVGINWAWVDTVCIDKTSSSELQENIASMFQIYKKAALCFAYLADVQNSNDKNNPNVPAEFATSRWFTRGWTVQELIGPRDVHFYDCNWTGLGSRDDLLKIITERTGIASTILRFGPVHQISKEEWSRFTGENAHHYPSSRADASVERRSTQFSASAAQIFSWVAKRQTTRDEDLAYCLLGLLDVAMPLLYGEGIRKAFRRLQEEVLRQSNDFSLLTWQRPDEGLLPVSERPGVLALTPRDFEHCNDIIRHHSVGHFSSSRAERVLNETLAVPAQVNTRTAALRVLIIRPHQARVYSDKENKIDESTAKYKLLLLNCYRVGDRQQILAVKVTERSVGVYNRTEQHRLYRVDFAPDQVASKRKWITPWKNPIDHAALSVVTCLTYR